MTERHPGGYSLIEVLVTIALLVVIATIVLPILSAGGAAERLDRADNQLKGLTDAAAAFFEDVTEWPGDLEDLVSPIDQADSDVCGQGYTGGERIGWAGPYLSVAVPSGGLDAGIGTVRPDFTMADGGEYDLLGMVVDNVELGDAAALDQMVDGDDAADSGTIQWTTPPVGGQVTLTWYIPITTC